jgi:hypothetical protein
VGNPPRVSYHLSGGVASLGTDAWQARNRADSCRASSRLGRQKEAQDQARHVDPTAWYKDRRGRHRSISPARSYFGWLFVST